MSAVFKVVGDHGYVQIDDKFFNFSLSVKNSFWLQDRAQITVSGEIPMLCFRNLSQIVHIESVQKVGDSYVYSLRGDVSQAGEQIAYYVFDRVPVVAKWGHGMAWNAAGQPVFNSDYPVMKIAAISPLPDADPWNAPVSISVASGTYAACLAMPRSRAIPVDWTGNGQYPVFAEGSRVTATGAETKLIRVGELGEPVDGFLAGGGQLMLIDVAGL